MNIRKIFLLSTSMLCYTILVGWHILLFVVFASVVIGEDCISDIRWRKFASVVTLLMLVGGFLFFKGVSSMHTIIGYSVFAFSGISFIADQTSNRHQYSIMDILVYLFFFPKMMAGPIVKAADFIPQLSASYDRKTTPFYQGFKLVLYGCFLKLIVADNILAAEQTALGINLLCQSFIWGIRLYIDFYAYSLMAVGVAQWMGIKLPYNFDSPYSSYTFKEVWKRWNITLSAWLRDYVYIPLGGNKKSKPMIALNIIVTFIISGLWHGISIPFVLWGLMHGLLVCLERFVFHPHLMKNKYSKMGYRFFVVVATMMLWQLFLFDGWDDGIAYIHHLLRRSQLDVQTVLTLLLSTMSLIGIESKQVKSLVMGTSSSCSAIYKEVTLMALMLVVLLLCPYKYTFDFFYFKF